MHRKATLISTMQAQNLTAARAQIDGENEHPNYNNNNNNNKHAYTGQTE
jgi:hypothetical protein